MAIIDSLIMALRVGIVPAFTVYRCIMCLIKITYNMEDKKMYIVRLVNTIAFFILSELVFVIKDIIEFYY